MVVSGSVASKSCCLVPTRILLRWIATICPCPITCWLKLSANEHRRSHCRNRGGPASPRIRAGNLFLPTLWWILFVTLTKSIHQSSSNFDPKLWKVPKVRSRLHRRRILRSNTRWKALDEIYLRRDLLASSCNENDWEKKWDTYEKRKMKMCTSNTKRK